MFRGTVDGPVLQSFDTAADFGRAFAAVRAAARADPGGCAAWRAFGFAGSRVQLRATVRRTLVGDGGFEVPLDPEDEDDPTSADDGRLV